MTATHPTPLAAYRQFFEAFNARDAERWAGVMSYPHVRVSPRPGGDRNRRTGVVRWRPSRVFDTAADYAAAASWEAIEATGWVRTEGIEPATIHEGNDKVHLAGGWTRFNARDEIIRENRVAYVITRIEGGWGIQARFGLDSFVPNADVSATREAALAAVDRLLEARQAENFESCGGACNFPLIAVGVGSVRKLEDAAAFAREFPSPTVAESGRRSIEAVQTGRRAVNVAATVGGTAGARAWRGLFLVTDREGHWGVEAISPIG